MGQRGAQIDMEKRTLGLRPIECDQGSARPRLTMVGDVHSMGNDPRLKSSKGLDEILELMNVHQLKIDVNDRNRLIGILGRNAEVLIERVEDIPGANLPPYKPKFTSDGPIYQRQYRIPHKLYAPIRKKIEGLERAGIISKTCANWNTPAMFLEKKAPSTDIRMVLDLRRINQIVEEFKYPLMRIDEIIDKLGGSKVFSTLDLNNGYFNVKLDDSVKDRFAFSAPFGRYRMERLPQGLSTSAGWFQKVMNEALQDVISDGHCMVFQDDVIIFTTDIEDHLRVLEMVMGSLRKINMAIRPSKCTLLQDSLKFLGHIVDQQGSRPTEENIESIRAFERPQTVKQVRSFLGTVNFYRKFIPGITEIADPLYKLLKKGNTKLEWDGKAEESFLNLKSKLISAPLLKYPDFTRDFIVKTDASGIGVGAVLEQKNDEGLNQPVAFCSRKLNDAERRYSAIEREALAIVYALGQFKHITYGYKIILETDHKPLSYVFSLKDTNMRLVRWLLQVQDHNILIEYRPGKFNHVADWLSRAHSDDAPLVSVAASHSMMAMSVEEIIECQQNDEECKRWILEVGQGDCPDAEVQLDENGLLVRRVIPARYNGWKYRVVVPRGLRGRIMEFYHDGVTGGHMAYRITAWKIRMMFTWRGMSRDIREYVRSCDVCQRRSMPRNKVPYQYVGPPSRPMSRLSVDILGPFDKSRRGRKYIVVWVDHFSRMTFASAINNMEAETIADDYLKNIFPRYGASAELISDRGGQFTGAIMKNMCARLSMKRVHTTPYNPQANGVTERVNSKILRVLSKVCGNHFSKWDEFLPFVVQNLNNSVHRSTGDSPFFIFHGFDQIHPGLNINSGVNNGEGGTPEVIAQMVERVNEARMRVEESLSDASRANTATQRGNGGLMGLLPGEKVLLLDSTSYTGRNRKLKERYKGPYRVVSKVGAVTYRISQISGEEVVKTVHLNKLKRYYDRKVLNDSMPDTSNELEGTNDTVAHQLTPAHE